LSSSSSFQNNNTKIRPFPFGLCRHKKINTQEEKKLFTDIIV
jgi:hypothetical protein